MLFNNLILRILLLSTNSLCLLFFYLLYNIFLNLLFKIIIYDIPPFFNQEIFPDQIKPETVIVPEIKVTVPNPIVKTQVTTIEPELTEKEIQDMIEEQKARVIGEIIRLGELNKMDREKAEFWAYFDALEIAMNNEKLEIPAARGILREEQINIDIMEPFNLTSDVVKNILIKYQIAQNLYDAGDSQAIFGFMQDNMPKELFHVYDINSDYNREIYFKLFEKYINNFPIKERTEVISQFELLKKTIIDYNDYCNEWNKDIFRL